MKKVFYPLACCCLAAGVFASCGGQKKANAPEEQKVALTYSKSLKAAETDSLNLPVDENGYITIFDGETFSLIQIFDQHLPESHDCCSFFSRSARSRSA